MGKTWKDRRDGEGWETETQPWELTEVGKIGPGIVEVSCHPRREQTVVEPHLLRPKEGQE